MSPKLNLDGFIIFTSPFCVLSQVLRQLKSFSVTYLGCIQSIVLYFIQQKKNSPAATIKHYKNDMSKKSCIIASVYICVV